MCPVRIEQQKRLECNSEWRQCCREPPNDRGHQRCVAPCTRPPEHTNAGWTDRTQSSELARLDRVLIPDKNLWEMALQEEERRGKKRNEEEKRNKKEDDRNGKQMKEEEDEEKEEDEEEDEEDAEDEESSHNSDNEKEGSRDV